MGENVNIPVKSVSERIKEVLHKKGKAGVQDNSIAISTADALMLFACFQKIVMINEHTLAILRRTGSATEDDADFLHHEAKELRDRAESFILSALDKSMGNEDE